MLIKQKQKLAAGYLGVLMSAISPLKNSVSLLLFTTYFLNWDKSYQDSIVASQTSIGYCHFSWLKINVTLKFEM